MLVVPRRALKDGGARFGAGAVVCAIRDERDLACAATAACWARELGRALLLAHVVPPRRLPATAVGMPHPAVLATNAERLAGGRRMLDEIACTIAPIAPRDCAPPRARRRGRPESRPAGRRRRKPRSSRSGGRARSRWRPRSRVRRRRISCVGPRARSWCARRPTLVLGVRPLLARDPGGASSTRSARALKKSLRVMTPRTRWFSTTGTSRTRWWRKISATCGVGEVAADVNVLGVHPVAHGFALAAGALLQRALERARDEAGVLELAEVAGEDGGDELALAEDAAVAPVVVDHRERGQAAVDDDAARRRSSGSEAARVGTSRRSGSVRVLGLTGTSRRCRRWP